MQYINDTVDLNDRNLILYAAKHYDNPQCHDMDEFNEDLQIPMHLKKLFTRYHVNGDLKLRLILNHVISFFNVFTPLAAVKILFLKLDAKHHSYLKTVLTYLNRCPDIILINGNYLNIKTDILIDRVLMNHLEKI